MTAPPNGPLLHYYYDLGKAPITFDSAVGLAIAAAYGAAKGYRGMKVVVIASRFRKLTPRERTYDLGVRHWRLFNIILRLTTLMPFVIDIELVRDNIIVLHEHRFPTDYDPNNPASTVPYSFGGLSSMAKTGGNLSVFRNTSYADAWAKSLQPVKEKSVVLSLRTADFDGSRDSNLDHWFTLYQHLTSKGYDVVVIPDQGDALGANRAVKCDWKLSTPAAMDIDLRLGLYRNCAMNFAWSSRVTTILYLSDAPFRLFGILNSAGHVTT